MRGPSNGAGRGAATPVVAPPAFLILQGGPLARGSPAGVAHPWPYGPSSERSAVDPARPHEAR